MVSANTLCKKLLNVKNAVVEDAEFYSDDDGVNHIRIHARPNTWHIDDCPFCHKRCRRYDKKNPLLSHGVSFRSNQSVCRKPRLYRIKITV